MNTAGHYQPPTLPMLEIDPLSGHQIRGASGSRYWAVIRSATEASLEQMELRAQRSAERMFARLARHPARGI